MLARESTRALSIITAEPILLLIFRSCFIKTVVALASPTTKITRQIFDNRRRRDLLRKSGSVTSLVSLYFAQRCRSIMVSKIRPRVWAKFTPLLVSKICVV